MTTFEERAVIAEISDRLIDLYVKRDEACEHSDLYHALLVQREIEAVSAERQRVIDALE